MDKTNQFKWKKQLSLKNKMKKMYSFKRRNFLISFNKAQSTVKIFLIRLKRKRKVLLKRRKRKKTQMMKMMMMEKIWKMIRMKMIVNVKKIWSGQIKVLDLHLERKEMLKCNKIRYLKMTVNLIRYSTSCLRLLSLEIVSNGKKLKAIL